ncbi:radical SAM protein [Methanoregula sp.]|uniref:radical SAM protein n=1 Tax=Methanoregula sp. TaxID=2052170 RepID=UPI0035647C1C
MEFESISGVRYYYDNEIGIAFPSHPLIEKMIQNVPLQEEDIPTVNTDDDVLFYSRFLQKLNKIRPRHKIPRKHPIQPEEVKQMVLHDGLYQMILGITEDCNLRCRYCVYSEAYTLSRKPSKVRMEFTTAKKALDWYISLVMEGREYNPVRKPAISFYGGEPLLNFDLIKKCVQYVKTTYPDLEFTFSLTTNGTLLNQEREDFLKEHGFLMNISIDGPKEEHDRNRIYQDGRGTFDDVMKNVRRFMSSGYDKDKFSSICVFDWKCNLFSLDAFFRQPDIPKLSLMTTPSVHDGCVYYDQFSDDDFQNYLTSEKKAFQYYLDHATDDTTRHSVFEQLYPLFASRFLYSIPTMIMPENRVIPYSGACILGRKIFVDVHGIFHPCERINQSFPIGDEKSGLDFTAIALIMNNYLEHLDSCKTCAISKTCGYCYNQFAQKGTFNYASEVCKKEEDIKKFDFSRTFTLGERYPHLLDMVVKDYYTWLSKVSPTLGD